MDQTEGEDAKTLSAESQRLVFRTNQLLWPWMQALCRLSERKELARIHEWWKRQGMPDMQKVTENHVVYMRGLTARSGEGALGP